MIGKYYETDDYISHASDARSVMDRVYYAVRRWMAGRKEALVSRYANGKALVDIGTGTGFFAAHMQGAGWQVKAFEPSSDARAIARKVHGLDVHDVDKLFELKPDSVDVVTMWHVLEHVHDPNAYIELIYNSLRAGGVALIALPNYTSHDSRLYGSDWGAWDVPRHLWHFSPFAVNQLLTRHGFRMKKSYVMRFDAFYVSLISEKYRGTGALGVLRAMIIGCWSNLVSLFIRSRGSSLIYVAQKKGRDL
jgi:2-polyprenyl-3-methyl-5-hydroxy-6-metoxy-1,4-benzoquinol methylase